MAAAAAISGMAAASAACGNISVSLISGVTWRAPAAGVACGS